MELQRNFSMQEKAAALYGGKRSPSAAKAAAQPMSTQTTAELMKIMADIKKEFGANKRQKPEPKQKSPTSVTFKETPAPTQTQIAECQKSWLSKFGKRTVKGKELKLCWHHCNHPKGCSRGLSCAQSHLSYPEAYKNKPFGKLPSDTQWSILKACKQA